MFFTMLIYILKALHKSVLTFRFFKIILLLWPFFISVGHRVLSRSECSVLSHSFKECSVLSRSFFEFLATFETQKNGTFFPILFKRTEKNIKNVPFFCKERKRTQRMQRSSAKNVKEPENVYI